MSEYKKILFLLYLKEVTYNYDFLEIKQLLGITQTQLEILLFELLDNEYIEYYNFCLKVTEKGLRYLVSKDSINHKINENEYNTKVLKNNDSLLYEPYIPKNFDKK